MIITFLRSITAPPGYKYYFGIIIVLVVTVFNEALEGIIRGREEIFPSAGTPSNKRDHYIKEIPG
jgi:hypothetical protein